MAFGRFLTDKTHTAGNGDISVQEARTRQVAGALLIDVRDAGEWAAGHAPGARHVPLSRFTEEMARLPVETVSSSSSSTEATPRRAKSRARVSPTTPPPTMATGTSSAAPPRSSAAGRRKA